ncbi:MAG: thioredoxin family protein, partial [Nitrososphaerales archaeon]
ELEQEVLKSNKPSLVIFAAKWCGYCNRFLAIVDAYSPAQGAPQVFVVDTDNGDGSLWDEYEVNVVPTIILFQDGKQIFKKEGRFGAGLREADLEEALNKAVHEKPV